jgi:plasmid stabilization system protein ParE
MAANIAFTQQARDDLTEAHDWYEQQRPGRGAKFLSRAQDCFATICRIPRAGRSVGVRHRQAVVQHFRYVVVYRYDDATDTVIVVAVFHTSRDPQDLLDRLT